MHFAKTPNQITIKYLVHEGCDLNYPNAPGKTPLLCAFVND